MNKHGYYTKVICALLSQPTIKEAAKALNMSFTTIDRIMAEPEFIEMYHEVQANLLSHTTGRLVANLSKATSILIEIIENHKYPVKIRLDGCKILFEYACKYTEISNILPRLKKLEQSLENQ